MQVEVPEEKYDEAQGQGDRSQVSPPIELLAIERQKHRKEVGYQVHTMVLRRPDRYRQFVLLAPRYQYSCAENRIWDYDHGRASADEPDIGHEMIALNCP